MAVFVAAVIATGPRFSSSGAGADPSVMSGAVDSTAAASPGPATPAPEAATPSTTSVSEPNWTVDLLGQLECNGPPATIGGDVGDIYGEGLSPESPEAAMDVLVASAIFAGLPVRGYQRTDLEGHWARLVYRVDGTIKAVVVLRDAGPEIDPGVWSVAGLRACDPAEFAPDSGLTGALTVWLDAEGVRVPTTTLQEIPGPGHCGWESTIWLRLDGSLYLRDPKGVLERAAVGPFDPDVTLPKDARSTGYHEGGRTIWRDGDADAIYVVMANRVERWPRALDPFMGCA